MSLSPRRRTLALTAGLLAVSTAGCVQPGPPGVAINKLSADIVFGVKEVVATPQVAPPNLASTPAAVVIPQIEQQTQDEEKVLPIPKSSPLVRPSVAATKSDCPAAALTAFPAKTADVVIQGTPKEGLYRFKRHVEIRDPDGAVRTTDGYEQRAVRRVVPNPAKAYEFSYQVLQPSYVSPTFTVTSFRVNSNPTVVTTVNRPPQTIGTDPLTTPGVDQQITPPQDEPGIFVDSIRTEDANGKEVSTFAPAPPIKYLPLDEGILRAGQTFDEVGISTRSLGVLRHTGSVVRKVRVDACGEVVEGWQVQATQTSSDSASSPRSYFYNIATQYGGLFIAENSVQTLADGTVVTIDLSLAALDPQPLPQALQ